MPSITYPNYPTNVALCSNADVTALLFGLPDVQNNTLPAGLITSAIASATSWVENYCNRSFSPKRHVSHIDGNGSNRMVLDQYPLININSVQVYYTYPVGLVYAWHEYDFIIDKKRGILAFPTSTAYPFFQPMNSGFISGSRNITLDYWTGFTTDVYGEALTTTDNLTYTFANPGVVKTANNTVGGATAPSFGPNVYLNGVPLINTTYSLAGVNQQNPTSLWNVNTDNIFYTTNTDTNGIRSITFPSSQAGFTITADYSYWSVPNDVKDAATKKAALTILNAVGTAGSGLPYTGGATQVQVDGFRSQFNDRGMFGPQIATWELEITEVLKQYKKMPFARNTSGYPTAYRGW